MQRVGFMPMSLALAAALLGSAVYAQSDVVRYARFRVGDQEQYGVLRGDRLHPIIGELFGEHRVADLPSYHLSQVQLLVPTEPRQVFALAGNYRSHLNSDDIPPKFRIPQPFMKPIGSLAAHGEEIIIPPDATDQVHYEAELVIVIGRQAKNVPLEEASRYVFGVTCGNDVSERFWQNDPEHKDVQWWRAKGADTFGPCGPFIARGLDHNNLLLQLRLNGELVQNERTDHLIHSVEETVSFMSRYVTLYPGDLIFTGTPGRTAPLKHGDVVEVELEGVGVLRNSVRRAGLP